MRSEAMILAEAVRDHVETMMRADLLDRESQLVQAIRVGRTVLDFPHPAGDGSMERYELPHSVARRWWWLRRAGYRLRRHGW